MTAVQLTIDGEPSEPVRYTDVRPHKRRVSGPPSAPLARNTDPDTSHEAARSTNGTRLDREVMTLFQTWEDGGLTDDQLLALYRHVVKRNVADGSVKTSRSRLSKAGFYARSVRACRITDAAWRSGLWLRHLRRRYERSR